MDKSTIKYIYRITHLDNIPRLLSCGIECPKSCGNSSEYTSIGDKSLIDLRKRRDVVVNGKTIILGDFIPFYFGYRMPMLYVIQNGRNMVEQAVSAENIVYLVCSIEDFVKRDFLFYFSDGHGMSNLSTFYDKNSINSINNIVDASAVWADVWSGESIERDLRRRKQAEFLVGQDIPPEMIRYFACYSEKTKQKLIAFGIREEQIFVAPEAYY